MQGEMEGAEVVDLTEDSFEEFRDDGQAISDEDFAKRLQMEEYETLRASDFLVAQQLQEEFRTEHSRHPENLAFQRFLHSRAIPRRFNVVRLSPPTAGSSHGTVSDSADALRPSRVQRAIERNRVVEHNREMGHDHAVEHDHAVGHRHVARHHYTSRHHRAAGRGRMLLEAEGVPQPPNATTAGDSGTLENDAPLQNPVQFVRQARGRGVVTPDMMTGHQRVHVGHGHRFRMVHPIIRVGGVPHLHRFDFNDGNNYEALLDLSERIGDAGNKGLTQAEVNRLPTIKYRSVGSQVTSSFGSDDLVDSACGTDSYSDALASGNADCQICLNNFSNDDLLRTLPCCHRFHVECIDQWIKRNAVCPVCRDDVKGHLRRSQDDWSHVDDFMS